MPERSTNTFQDGMRLDVDKLNQSKSSYRYSLNGRLVFNKDGTFSWERPNGQKDSFQIEPNNGLDLSSYSPLGYAGQDNLIVLISKSQTNNFSEIGLFITDNNGIGEYKTLFNDANDPNGDLLDLHLHNQIEARFVYETDNILRIYFVDGVANDSNQPRVFTFKYDNLLPKNDVNSYSAVTTSVHSINSQSEINLGLIKYIRTIVGQGNLLSGQYQYTYRLASKVGYRTPWYPLTRPVFVTTDNVSTLNPWEYEMESSGLDTAKAIELEVKGIDLRFDEIEVAYVFLTTDSTPTEANIFSIVEISSNTMTFTHRSNDGEVLLIEEIPAFYQGIRKAKTLNIKDTTLYYGNIVESSFDVDTELVLQNLQVEAYFRDMRSDQKNIDPFFQDGRDSYVAGSSGLSVPPVMLNDVYPSEKIIKSLHSGVGGTEDYDIKEDYINYKGTQVSHLTKGYFRGETYRFGIVFFDKLGFQSFVYHLCDVKLPQQSSDVYTANRVKEDDTVVPVATVALTEKSWTTTTFGAILDDDLVDGVSASFAQDSFIRVLGLKFHGIDITTIKNQISGFMIVRASCDNEILGQGLLMSCTRQDDNSRPMPFGVQKWQDLSTALPPTAASNTGDVILDFGEMEQGVNQATATAGNTNHYLVRPNLSVLYMPDYMFEYAQLPIAQTSDRLTMISGAWQLPNPVVPATLENAEANQYFTWEEPHSSPTRGRCQVRKLYSTKENYHQTAVEPYPVYLSEAEVTEIIPLGLGESKDNYDGILDLKNEVIFSKGGTMGYSENGAPMPDHVGDGMFTMFVKHGNFQPPGIPKVSYSPFLLPNGTQHQGSWVCNYKRPNNNPYGGLNISSLETTIFFSTGHFQPVNNPLFDTQGMPLNDIFDDVEVWGGDCVLDYFGFVRVYGRFKDPANWNNDPFDTAIGEIFPLESRVHHPMRLAPSQEGPIYPSVGIRPQYEYESGGTDWPDGIFHTEQSGEIKQLLEEFNINAVLFYQETVMLYSAKPLRFQFNSNFPVRWRYSQSKFYGDEVDSWRVFLVNDFRDLNGEYGSITSSMFLFNAIYSLQESALGRLRASDRALVESANQGSLTTGIGEKLDGVDYVNTEFGNQHQWSLFSSGKAFYWVDVNNRKICRFAQDGFINLSDARGMHQFAVNEFKYYENKDTPVDGFGITGVYDFNNNEALFSFIRNRTITLKDDIYITDSISKENYYELDNLDLFEFINSTAVNLNVIKNNTAFGSNNLLAFYLYNNGVNTINVNQVDNTGTTLITNLTSGNTIKIFRNSLNDDWEFTGVTLASLLYKKYNVLGYNESGDYFNTFYSYNANFYIKNKTYVLVYDTNISNQIYVDGLGDIGRYSNVIEGSIFEPIFNENASMTKVFDNFLGNATYDINDSLVSMHMFTETNYEFYNVLSDTRKEYREDILRMPLRTETQGYRMRGKHLTTILKFSSLTFDKTRITSISINYRLSNPR